MRTIINFVLATAMAYGCGTLPGAKGSGVQSNNEPTSVENHGAESGHAPEKLTSRPGQSDGIDTMATVKCDSESFVPKTDDGGILVNTPTRGLLSLTLSDRGDGVYVVIGDAASTCVDGIHQFAYWGERKLDLISDTNERSEGHSYFVKAGDDSLRDIGYGEAAPHLCSDGRYDWCEVRTWIDNDNLYFAIIDRTAGTTVLRTSVTLASRPQYFPLFVLD